MTLIKVNCPIGLYLRESGEVRVKENLYFETPSFTIGWYNRDNETGTSLTSWGRGVLE